MKRLTLLLLGLALGVTATANAQGLTMQMSNGWAFSFGGNVNAFWVFTHQDSSAATGKSRTYSNVRTGLLPAFATFEARGKEAGMNLLVHVGFAPQIQNGGNAHDAFVAGSVQAGAQIDMRQVYMTFGGDWGQILAGRELGLFQRQNILNDQTLFGIGAVGGVQGGGTTLGRIGYGYIYPNFNAQLTYSSLAKNPAQISIGLFQPSVMSNGYTQTKIPRVEAEVTWHQTQGKNKYTVWVGGEWQSVSHITLDSTVSAVGGTAGVRLDMQELSVVVSGYIGSGLGATLAFVGDELANGRNKRKSDGGYVQLGYTLEKKTTVAASWGFGRLKGAGTTSADGTAGPIGQVQMYTAGIYHQWTKSLKLVFEGSREINSHAGAQAVLSGLPNQTDISGGFMLFF
jgi:hypothetical protein